MSAMAKTRHRAPNKTLKIRNISAAMTLNTAVAIIIPAKLYLLSPQWIMQTDKRILRFYNNGIKIMHELNGMQM